MLGRHILAKAHQAADSCWSCVDGIHLVLLDNLPKAVCGRVGWYTLKQYTGSSVHQWTVNNIAMSCHPTYIGGTPKDVARLNIKHKFGGGIYAHRVATLNVYNSLWLARAAAGVKDIKHILAVHRLTRYDGVFGNIFQQVFQVHITTLRHRHFLACAPHDDQLLNIGCLGNSLIRNFLEFDNFAASIAAIGSDEHLGLAVDHAV